MLSYNDIKKYFDGMEIGEPVNYRNLAVFPLLRQEAPSLSYLTLDDAVQSKKAKVTELSESGSVPELFFVNEGEKPVLLVEGEELIGAKQNRILNISVLAPAARKIKINVSCVESGRWHPVSKDFVPSNRVFNSKARAVNKINVAEFMSKGLGARSNQGEVWRQVDKKLMDFKIDSKTSALSEVFEAKENVIKEFVEEFNPSAYQVGAVFAINGKLVGVEFFDNPDTFKKLSQKLIRSYAIDAITEKENQKDLKKEDVELFINDICDSLGSEHNVESLGKILNYKNTRSNATILEYEGIAVHFAAYLHEN